MKKTVIITGCSSGIGFETALFLAERNFQVYATMRNLEDSIQLKQEAVRRNTHLECLPLDVTDPISIQTTLDTIQFQSDGIYALVNNAGINLRGFFEDLTAEEMHRVFHVNVFGTMAVTRATLPFMRSVGRGRIVIIGSVGGKLPTIGNSAYCSTKFALEGFGQTLAQEINPFGLKVSIIEPGFVATELFRKNRQMAKQASDPKGAYYKWFLKMEAITDELSNKPIATPNDVAVVVHDALTSRSPALNYIVGRRAKILLALKKYLPGELFNRIWMKETFRRINKLETPKKGND